MNSDKEADLLIGCELFLAIRFTSQIEGNQFYYHEVVGFRGKTSITEAWEPFKAVNDASAQPLFIIEHQKRSPNPY